MGSWFIICDLYYTTSGRQEFVEAENERGPSLEESHDLANRVRQGTSPTLAQDFDESPVNVRPTSIEPLHGADVVDGPCVCRGVVQFYEIYVVTVELVRVSLD